MFDELSDSLTKDGVRVRVELEQDIYYKMGATIVVTAIVMLIGTSAIKGILGHI